MLTPWIYLKWFFIILIPATEIELQKALQSNEVPLRYT